MKLTRHLLLCGCAALLAVSCQNPPAPPPGQPIDTVVVPATPQETLGRLQGRDSCQSGPGFELSYALDTWQLRDETLDHLTIPGCVLQLDAIAQQVAGPKRQTIEELGGFSWEMSAFPNAWLTSFWLEERDGCYLFSVAYSEALSPDEVDSCQQAARRVIDSFVLVGE